MIVNPEDEDVLRITYCNAKGRVTSSRILLDAIAEIEKELQGIARSKPARCGSDDGLNGKKTEQAQEDESEADEEKPAPSEKDCSSICIDRQCAAALKLAALVELLMQARNIAACICGNPHPHF